MTSLRPLLRLAARDARRDRWRSLLVLVIVALPVAGLVAAATLTDSTQATAEQNATAQMGRADLALFGSSPADDGPVGDAGLLAALGELPDGTEVEVLRTLPGSVVVDGLALPLSIEDASLDPDALTAGQRDLLDGTRPTSLDAVSVSVAMAERAGLALGDLVAVDPIGEVTVVGIHRSPEHLSRRSIAVAPGALADHPDASPVVLVGLPSGTPVPDLPNTMIDGASGAEDPILFGQSREQVLSERFSQGERGFFVIIGGLAAVEVALVAGAAFAVSVRRRQRELGLLAATGGTRTHVRRSVLLTGVTVGLTGSVLGVVLGLGGTWAALPAMQGVVDRVVDGLRVDPVWLVGPAILGTVAAVVGAWWPARSVARLPVLTALSGRRPTPAPSRSGLVKGLVLAGAGVGLCLVGSSSLGGNSFVFLAGSIAVVLGAGLTSPWLLEQLGRTARFLPAGPRLAVRDAARFRTRNGPIVTAAMAGLAASISIGAVVTSLDASDAAEHRPMLPTDVLFVQDGGVQGAGQVVSAAVGRPAAAVRPLAASVVEPAGDTDDAGYEHVHGAVVEPEVAVALAGADAGADLSAGRAVALRDTGLEHVELRMDDGETLGPPLAAFPVVVHEVEFDVDRWLLPLVLIPATAETLDVVQVGPGAWTDHLILLDREVDEATLGDAARAAASLGPEVFVTAELGYQSDYAGFARFATIVGGLAGLLLVAIAIALAAAESRGDLRTLAAVGAGRGTRRSLAAGRALLLSGLGGLLAVPVGLVPAAALLTTLTGRPPLVLPWQAIGVVVLLVPLLATAGAVLASTREPAGLTRAA